MNITKTHLDYWSRRKAPAWAKSLTSKWVHPTIDEVVDANAGFVWTDGLAQASNTLSLLRSARKLGHLRATLERIAVTPGTVVNPKRRAGYARKWLLKINTN